MSSLGNSFKAIGSALRAVLWDNPLVKVVRFAASATIGIPIALVATAALLPAKAIFSVAKTMSSVTLKFVGGARVQKFNAWLEAAANNSGRALSAVWRGFGIYAGLQMVNQIRKHSGKIAAALGTGKLEAEAEAEASAGGVAPNYDEEAFARAGDGEIEKLSPVEESPPEEVAANLSESEPNPVVAAKPNDVTPTFEQDSQIAAMENVQKAAADEADAVAAKKKAEIAKKEAKSSPPIASPQTKKDPAVALGVATRIPGHSA